MNSSDHITSTLYAPTKSLLSAKELLGDWKVTKSKLKQKFAILNQKDLLLLEGKEEEMIASLQIRLCKTKNEMYTIIDLL